MMNPGWIVAALLTGIVLGAFYFGGLWLRVRQIPRVRRPALLLVSSFIARITVFLLGLYLVMDGQLVGLVTCLGGFFTCRGLLIHRLGRTRPLPEVSPWKS